MEGKVKTLIGGLAASKEWAKEIGADDWVETAIDGVEEAKKLFENRT
ncbi:MAG: hypothetical protein ACTSUV_06155 [Candidatus Ranarchaeia archaeon]